MKKTDKKIVIYEKNGYVFSEYYENNVVKRSSVEPVYDSKHSFTENAIAMFNRLTQDAYDAENNEYLPKAQIDDWIELTDPFYTSEQEYDRGARFKVVYTHENGDVCVFDDGLVAIPASYFNIVTEKVKTEKAETASKAEPKPARDTNFKVGDKVRFRSWEDMEEEYGSMDGDIDCNLGFPIEMKPLCGTTAIIDKIYYDGEIKLTEFSNPNGVDTLMWAYTTDMVEKV